VNLAIFASLYIIISTIIGLMLGDLSGPEDPRRGRAAADLPLSHGAQLHRDRHCVEMDARPGIGFEAPCRLWGWESFSFDWIKDSDMAIYTIVIAAVWQSSGFVMAMFLAGLRGIDNEILKAAQMDGASNWNLYRRIILPQLGPRSCRPSSSSAIWRSSPMTLSSQ
jgi:glucose/mannose transport system permease protein